MSDFDIFGWDRTTPISWRETCQHDRVVRWYGASNGRTTWFCAKCTQQFSPRPVSSEDHYDEPYLPTTRT
jgi:hypothetical protein